MLLYAGRDLQDVHPVWKRRWLCQIDDFVLFYFLLLLFFFFIDTVGVAFPAGSASSERAGEAKARDERGGRQGKGEFDGNVVSKWRVPTDSTRRTGD